jgi:biopolymer transport protein ExbD
MIHKRNKSERRKTNVELNITAFMNLMVVLVPFLLMTAAFTTTSILDLHLPKPDAGDSASDAPKEFAINVVMSKAAIIITDQNGDTIKHIPKTSTGHNYPLLNQTLRAIKYKYPEKTDISILSEKYTPYEDIVQAMDKSREFHTFENNEVVAYDLFPDISIGDSPAMAQADSINTAGARP